MGASLACAKCEQVIMAHIGAPGVHEAGKDYHRDCYLKIIQAREQVSQAAQAALPTPALDAHEARKIIQDTIVMGLAAVGEETKLLRAAVNELHDAVMAANQRVFELHASQEEMKGMLAEAMLRPGALISKEVALKLEELGRKVDVSVLLASRGPQPAPERATPESSMRHPLDMG